MITLAQSTSLTFSPALPWYVLIPSALLAILLVIYLYREQRKLASRPAVITLTTIRISLLLLIALLLLQPSLQYTTTRKNAGTLWILADHSLSMHSLDPQSSPREKLHWADALGHLSSSLRETSGRPDLLTAHVAALEDSFANLSPQLSTVPDTSNPALQARQINAFLDTLTPWTDQADAIVKLIKADPALQKDSAPLVEKIDRAAALLRAGIVAARKKNTLHEASDAINWPTIQANLTLASREISALALAADTAFLRTHSADSSLSSGLSRVTKVPRSELAFLALTASENRPQPLFRSLPEKYRTRLAGFADSAQATGTVDVSTFGDILKQTLNARPQSPALSISPSPPTSANIPSAPGQAVGGLTNSGSTSIAAALQLVSEQLAPDEPASVILLTDGRHNLPGDPAETARLLAARGVRVYGILVGSALVSPDAAVEQVDAPDWIYRDDTLTARALIRLDGLQNQKIRVELLRAGVVVSSETLAVTSAQSVEPVTFIDKPPVPPTASAPSASFEYEIRAVPALGESNLANNRQSFRVTTRRDKLFALLIDDRPRWEFRYLATFLERDSRLKTQTILLNPAKIAGIASPPPVKASPNNPRPEAQLLPQTLEEWQAFDFLIIGDVPPSTFTPEQQQFIAASVRDKGATLITIAGERQMPAAYARTPLSDLLPVTEASQFTTDQITRHAKEGFRIHLAPEGHVSLLGQLGLDAASNTSLWSATPAWYWHSPFTQAKPSASVIWSFSELDPSRRPDNNLAPPAPPPGSLAAARRNSLLSSLNIGLGKSLHLASDQSWRLRQVQGHNIHDRFWGQVVRWAVGSELPAGGKFVRFGASRARYAQGEPVTITAKILKEDLTPYTGLAISATARFAPTAPSAPPTPILATASLSESPDAPGYYRGTLGGLSPGDLEISLQSPETDRLLDSDPTVIQRSLLIKISPQLNLEQRNTNTDLAQLTRITRAGNGFTVLAPYADVLAAHLPDIQQTLTLQKQIGLFTSPDDPGTYHAHWLFFALFALLLTLEWTLRKRSGLI